MAAGLSKGDTGVLGSPYSLRSALPPAPRRPAGRAVAATVRCGRRLGHPTRSGQPNELVEFSALALRALDRGGGLRCHERFKSVFALAAGIFIQRHRSSPSLAALLVQLARF